MAQVKYIGLDIAKNVFQAFMADEKGHRIANRKHSRATFLPFMANIPPCTIGIEACGGACNCARKLMEMGHPVQI